MASRIDDRWLWLGAGIAFCAVAHAIRYAVKDIISLTELSPQEDKVEDPQDKQPEDSMSIETLRNLFASPNSSISNAAISLVVSRFTRLPNASAQLKRDAASSNPALKRKAQTAINFLSDWPMPPGMDLPAPHADPARDDYYGTPRSSIGDNLNIWDYVNSNDVSNLMLYGDDTINDGLNPRWSPEREREIEAARAGFEATRWGGTFRAESGPVRETDTVRPDYQASPSPPQDPGRRRSIVEPETPDDPVPWPRAQADRARQMRRRREVMVLHEGAGRIVDGDIILPRRRSSA